MTADLQNSYDIVAADYAEHFRNELDDKPFDRKMLDWLGEKVGAGLICDMGCGPGQIARYLNDKDARTCGIDLSNGMVENARALNPGIKFEQGDMTALTKVADDSLGGIAAFYSIIHIPRQHLETALLEFKRVLKPGGTLLLTFHIGDQTVHMDEWFERQVSIDFNFLETAKVKAHLIAAGFELQEVIERDPYPEIEYQSRRAYIFARA
jgi:ubiquinone/menaquinone biosynthesis C-methylase UbiE